jgi:PKD repeat protein
MAKYLILYTFFICSTLAAQSIVNKGSTILHTEAALFGIPQYSQEIWDIELANKTASDNVYTIPKTEILKMKAALDQRRLLTDNHTKTENRSDSKPSLGVNFNGNIQGNNVPPDNTMAVSKNGFVVSSINSNIIFTNSAGKLNFTQNLTDFYTLLDIGSSVYDSRILYDAELNRFVVMALHGNTSQTTKIVLAFSKYEDPSAGWYYYSIKGNPLNDPNWFDYPNVGMTQKDLFISGLIRNSDGDWQYSILFQLDKLKCFKGEPIAYKYYSDIKNEDGTKGFNIVPTHSAWSTYPSQKMHFISNVAQGGNKYYLHTIDGAVADDPVMTAKVVTGLQTALAPDGAQKGTPNVMNTFDSRIWNAMELNGIIHFGAHVNSPANTSSILYGRYDLATDKVSAQLYYDAKYDYGFPSIASIGDTENSDKVLINFLKTGKDIYPSQVAILCQGTGDTFDWGKEVTTKAGTGSVDALTDNRERWGDYTTVSRRFFDQKPEVWITGCYGRSGSYGTWLAQYFADSTSLYIDYTADSTAIVPGQSSTFSILSPKQYTIESWTFEGGSPASSTSKNPKIKYTGFGTYDVTVKLIDNMGIAHTIVKKDYITVAPKVIAPLANFEASNDTIYQGQLVQFSDKSINDPIQFIWTFQNGIPNASKEKNPLIQYTKKGSHYVNLSVKNIAGQDNEIKQKFITVLEVSAPIANFNATKTNAAVNEEIIFNDLTTNYPLSWKWSFPGGNPAASTERNPKVTYSATGNYDVTLEATNALTSGTVTKTSYVSIGAVGTHDEEWIKNVSVYPNPLYSGDKLNVLFFFEKGIEASITISNAAGRTVKHLLRQKVKAGENQLSFSTQMLTSDTYFLTIETSEGRKVLPFTIL